MKCKLLKMTDPKFVLSVIFLTMGILLYGLNTVQIIHAQVESNSSLIVSGTATTSVETDQVTISFGVITTNDTAKKALDENSKIMNQVIESLIDAGIKQNQTSTDTFSVSPEYNYSNSGINKIIGYTATNSIQIKSNDLSNVSEWIDVASSAGANKLNNIYFSISEDRYSKTKDSLIKNAINDAKNKAEIASSAAGVKITGIKAISIDPITPIFQRNMEFPMTASFKDSLSSDTPIVSGEQEVSVNVGMVYYIK